MIWLILIGIIVVCVIVSQTQTSDTPISTGRSKSSHLNKITCDLITDAEYQRSRDNKTPLRFEVELPKTLYKKDKKVISMLKENDPLDISWWEEESETSRSWGIQVATIDGKVLGRPPYSLKTEISNRFDFIKGAKIERIDPEAPRIWALIEF